VRPLVECVPNFSEGRDLGIIDQIAAAATGAGAALLDRTSDADHNRSVLTLAGPPETIAASAFAAVEKAAALIDLRSHSGVHPRIGAADVVPFVPLENITLEECAALAWRVGERIWTELAIPVYFYEAAARRTECADLAAIRRAAGGLPPDLGGKPHRTAGACVIGARKFLIAFNVDLDTTDVRVAQEIARRVRARSGGLACVKALGLFLESRGRAQVSMNLVDYEVTPLGVAFDAVRAEANRLGVDIAGTEIIGLVPQRAIGGFHVDPDVVLENRLRRLQ
jgi:glutamate formiminotransferase